MRHFGGAPSTALLSFGSVSLLLLLLLLLITGTTLCRRLINMYMGICVSSARAFYLQNEILRMRALVRLVSVSRRLTFNAQI